MIDKSLGPYATLRFKIPLAWSHTLKQIAAEQKRPVESIITDALGEYLFKYHKGGNTPTSHTDKS